MQFAHLELPKNKKVKHPLREPDMISKRGVPYYFSPEWVRITNGTVNRICPIKNTLGDVDLFSVSRAGNVIFIQGSIQREFHDWHQDNLVDCILLGMNEEDLLDTNWEYE